MECYIIFRPFLLIEDHCYLAIVNNGTCYLFEKNINKNNSVAKILRKTRLVCFYRWLKNKRKKEYIKFKITETEYLQILENHNKYIDTDWHPENGSCLSYVKFLLKDHPVSDLIDGIFSCRHAYTVLSGNYNAYMEFINNHKIARKTIISTANSVYQLLKKGGIGVKIINII